MPAAPLNDPSDLVDLAAERLGGAVLAANDEFFAPKESLIKAEPPVFVPDRYTDRGKWMDGWETRRRRTPGHDWCILRLGLPGVLRRLVVDTRHFRGNFPESFALEASGVEGAPDVERLVSSATSWLEVVPRTPLAGDSENVFAVDCPWRFTHLRLDIFPDGGVARLRAWGEVVADWRGLADEVDLAALDHGAAIAGCSDAFFGTPHRLLLPGPALGMFDGWETRRRRGPGHDWVVVRLAAQGILRQVEVDTSHFKGNAPGSCSLEGRDAGGGDDGAGGEETWTEVLPPTALAPNAVHRFAAELRQRGPFTHARLNIFPDGGVARLRLLASPTPSGRAEQGLRWLNALPPAEAATALAACCASRQWCRRVAELRPFASADELAAAAERVWWELSGEDWREAFAAHPRLGELASPAAGGGGASWAAAEQAAAGGGPRQVLDRLVEANRLYAERFGYTFLVCATGKSADELLAAYERRFPNSPEEELRIAAGEQSRITRLRLAKLLGAGPPAAA